MNHSEPKDEYVEVNWSGFKIFRIRKMDIRSIVSYVCLVLAISLPMGFCLLHEVPTIDPSQNLPAFVLLTYINVSASMIAAGITNLWKRDRQPV
jgi:hypothetical protein